MNYSRLCRQTILTLLLVFTFVPIKAQSNEKTAIRETIILFFEGFHERDEAKMQSVLDQQATFHSIDERGEVAQLRTIAVDQFLNAVVSRSETPEWEERLHDFTIEVDGTIAQAWVTYSFWLGGSFSHCGVDAFSLFKSGDQWKISYLIDSRRKEPCDF